MNNWGLWVCLGGLALSVLIMLVCIVKAAQWELLNTEWDHSDWTDSEF